VNPMRIFPYIFLMTVLMVICGCAYPISQEMRAKARQDLTYPVVARNPVAYTGDTVIWCGVVVRVQNHLQQTELTILETPLHSWGEPMDEVYGRGRFLADK